MDGDWQSTRRENMLKCINIYIYFTFSWSRADERVRRRLAAAAAAAVRDQPEKYKNKQCAAHQWCDSCGEIVWHSNGEWASAVRRKLFGSSHDCVSSICSDTYVLNKIVDSAMVAKTPNGNDSSENTLSIRRRHEDADAVVHLNTYIFNIRTNRHQQMRNMIREDDASDSAWTTSNDKIKSSKTE